MYYPSDQFPLWNRRAEKLEDEVNLLNIDEGREAGVILLK
jgi:hypothetical protein